MPTRWQTQSLKQAGVILIDCDHRTPPADESGLPYVTIPQIKDGRIELSGARLISESNFIEWTRKANPTANDVVLSRRCNPGESAYVPEGMRFALGQNLVLLRSTGASIHPPFLRWLIRGPDWWEQVNKFINVGAIFNSLKCKDIPNFELPIPPVEEQKRIVEVLGSLDEKIELNRKMNETLEQMARAIFKSWFIDFDPIHAKRQGKKPIGMDDATAALFPDSFEKSDLGEVPKGWKLLPTDQVFEVNPKYSLSKGSVYSYTEMADLPTGSMCVSTSRPREFTSGSRFSSGDTLIARITPCLENGKTAYVDYLEEGQLGWGSTEFIVLRSRSPFPLEASYLLARDEAFRNHLITNMSGSSGRQRVQESCLSRYILAKPTPQVADAFGRIVKPMFEMIRANTIESQTLSQTRDLLLPRLLSGELTIKETA